MTTPSTAILQIDGHILGSVQNVDGGFTSGAVVDQPAGPEGTRIKHVGVAEIAPLSFEIGAIAANGVVNWMAATVGREAARRNISIVTPGFERDGYDALISSITMPALNRGSTANGFIKLTCALERVRTLAKASKPTTAPPMHPLSSSEFRFTLEGLLSGGKEVQSVDSFTIRQGIVKMHVGAERDSELEPGKLEFPNLVIHVPEAQAGGFSAWQEQQASAAANGGADQKRGRLEYFSRGRTLVVAFELSQVDVVSIAKASGGRTKVVLSCGGMALEGAPT